LKRPKQLPYLLLNQRAPDLAEAPGLTHVIPAATFQPNQPDDHLHRDEFSFTENIIREFAEELLGQPDRRDDASRFLNIQDMYTQDGARFRTLVRERDVCELLYLGMVIDPLSLKPEVLTVLMIHEAYLESMSSGLAPSWESVSHLVPVDLSEQNLAQLVRQENLVPTGKAHLWLALQHFDQLSLRLRQL
jgi:hypothetical protein